MSEEEKKDKKISSSDSGNEDNPKDEEFSNAMDTESTEANKEITFKVDVPEGLQRECELGPAITEERWVYMLDELNKFFADRNVQMAMEKPFEFNSNYSEEKLNVSFEDISSSYSFKDHFAHRRSIFHEPVTQVDTSENNTLSDPSRLSPINLREESISPIPHSSETSPPTFGRPLQNTHSLSSTSTGKQLQSDIPQITVAEADSSVCAEVSENSEMDVGETGSDLQGEESIECMPRNVSHQIVDSGSVYAESITSIFKFLLQDLLELQNFLNGREPHPWEPSTSSGYTGSIVDLAAISENFGTGVESNAAIASRHVLQDIEIGFNASIMTQVLRDRKHQRQRTSHRISPISPKPDKTKSLLGKKSESGSSKGPSSPKKISTSPKKEPATLDPRIEVSDISEVTNRLRSFNVQARDYLGNCIGIIREVLWYCCSTSPRKFLPRMEKLVGKVIQILQRLATLRKECSSLLLKCTNRDDYAGIVYILKVKTQIATGYNELLQQLLTFISRFNS